MCGQYVVCMREGYLCWMWPWGETQHIFHALLPFLSNSNQCKSKQGYICATGHSYMAFLRGSCKGQALPNMLPPVHSTFCTDGSPSHMCPTPPFVRGFNGTGRWQCGLPGHHADNLGPAVQLQFHHQLHAVRQPDCARPGQCESASYSPPDMRCWVCGGLVSPVQATTATFK